MEKDTHTERDTDRQTDRDRDKDSDSDGLILPDFKPIDLGGWGDVIVTNSKQSMYTF